MQQRAHLASSTQAAAPNCPWHGTEQNTEAEQAYSKRHPLATNTTLGCLSTTRGPTTHNIKHWRLDFYAWSLVPAREKEQGSPKETACRAPPVGQMHRPRPRHSDRSLCIYSGNTHICAPGETRAVAAPPGGELSLAQLAAGSWQPAAGAAVASLSPACLLLSHSPRHF